MTKNKFTLTNNLKRLVSIGNYGAEGAHKGILYLTSFYLFYLIVSCYEAQQILL